MKYRIIFFVLFIALKANAQEKLMEQPHALEIVEKGLFCIYNTDSKKADGYIKSGGTFDAKASSSSDDESP